MESDKFIPVRPRECRYTYLSIPFRFASTVYDRTTCSHIRLCASLHPAKLVRNSLHLVGSETLVFNRKWTRWQQPLDCVTWNEAVFPVSAVRKKKKITVNQGKVPQARAARLRFQAPTLLVHTEVGHVKLDGNTMTCLWSRNPLIIPPTLLVSVFREASKMTGTALIRSCTRLQPLDRAFFDFHCVCAKSVKSTRPVARFVQVTVFFEQLTDSVQ